MSNHLQLLQAQVVVLAERIQALEAATGAVGSFTERLVKENVNLDNRLMELQMATGGHLHDIDEAFKKADKMMEELRAAGRAASSAAAHAVASSVGAASSGGASPGTTPGLTRTDLNGLRVQLDQVAATQLDATMALEGRITEAEDRAVGQLVASDNAISELTTLALAANNAVRQLDVKHAAGDARLQ